MRLPSFRLNLGNSLRTSADVANGPSVSSGDACGPEDGVEEMPHDQLGLGGMWPDEEGGSPSAWDQEAADFLFS